MRDGVTTPAENPTTVARVERFWAARGHQRGLIDGGFLQERGSFGESLAERGVFRADDLYDSRCVVLLGEPGAGKSTALDDDGLLAGSALGGSNLRFDLATYGSEDRLIAEVFREQTLTAWAAGTEPACIVLDSLDEAKSRIPHVGTVLADRLRGLPRARMSLRIACRTADWSEVLEGALKELFDGVTIVEILPLRRVDAGAIAAAWCDPVAFLGAVQRAGAEPLAARPLTLRFLAREFGKTGELPAAGAALYRAAIRSLCEEQGLSRRDSGTLGALNVEQRVAVCRRMASE